MVTDLPYSGFEISLFHVFSSPSFSVQNPKNQSTTLNKNHSYKITHETEGRITFFFFFESLDLLLLLEPDASPKRLALSLFSSSL